MTSLWGAIDAEIAATPPVAILGEQATAITELTKGVVRGNISKHAFDGKFSYVLSLIAPALDGYMIEILTVKHDINLYPVSVEDHIRRKSENCSDEGELTDALASVLGSAEVHRVVSSLLSQSKAA